MRIAVVTETYAPEINGVALTVEAMVRELGGLGHSVELVRPRQWDGQAPRDGDEVLVKGFALPRYPGLRFGWCSARSLRARWSAERPDAVYVGTEGPLGWNAVRAARALEIPVATGFHTRFDDYMAHYGWRSLAPLALAYLRRFHNAADVTLAPTRELADWLSSQRIPRVELLARGVDTELFHPARRDPTLRASIGARLRDPVLLYVGRIAPEKNLALAVEAYDAVRARSPGARMVWVGGGPDLDEWRARRPDIVLPGIQRGAELARWFASADAFVFPSLSETFGNVTLEALASGLPVLAFDYGAAGAHVQTGIHGRLAACGDAAQFVRAGVSLVDELIEDEFAAAGYRARAREATARLSHRAVAQQLVSLLEPYREEVWRAA